MLKTFIKKSHEYQVTKLQSDSSKLRIYYNTLFIGVIVKCSTFLLVSSVSTKGQTKCYLTVSCFAVIDNQCDSVRKEPSKRHWQKMQLSKRSDQVSQRSRLGPKYARPAR